MSTPFKKIKKKFQLKKNCEVCPHCGNEHECNSRSKKGAKTVRFWTKLSEPCKEFLLWWLNSKYAMNELSKEQLHEAAKPEKSWTLGHIEGRVSEAYGLDLLINHKYKTWPHSTYSLNISKLSRVLENDGRLEGLAAPSL